MAIVALWWLKPVFDRFVLHVVSRAVFGAPPTVAETLAAWRDILQPGLVASLFWVQRLSPWRSFTLPVWQLEKQTGRAAHERRDALGRRMAGYGGWLTLVAATFEGIVLLSALLAVALLAPAAGTPGFEFSELFRGGGPEPSAWDLHDSLCYVVAVSVVEPIYVASGFSLYLNRRAILEGWDIELALRRLDARLRSLRAAAAAALAIAIACLAAAPPPANAAEKSAPAEIKEVLKAPEFQTSREAMGWRYRGERKDARPRPVRRRFLGERRCVLRADLAVAPVDRGRGGRGGARLLAAALAAPVPRRESGPVSPPDALFGLAVTPESLPDDVAGDRREARARREAARGALAPVSRRALGARPPRPRAARGGAHRGRLPARRARDAAGRGRGLLRPPRPRMAERRLRRPASWRRRGRGARARVGAGVRARARGLPAATT